MKVDFIAFVSMLATQVLVSLGVMPHPASGKTEKDLEQAQVTIEILEMLEGKTKGNLTKDEETALQQILSELRMAFVRASTSEPRT